VDQLVRGGGDPSVRLRPLDEPNGDEENSVVDDPRVTAL
jgi:hypothetical protein